MPRWVKVFGVVAASLVALFVVLQFVSGGEHGPGRHGGGGAPTTVPVDGGHAPPPGINHGDERP